MVNDSGNAIAVYTVLCILRRMGQQVCLEGMLEYMRRYLEAVEKDNPKLKKAVEQAVSTVDVKKIYKDALR